MKLRTILLTVLITAICGSFAFCEDDDRGPGSPGGRGRLCAAKGGGIKMILRLDEKLELTEEQVEKLEALQDEHKPKAETIREQLKDAHEALREAVEAGAEESKIRAAAAAVGVAMGERAVLQVEGKKAVDAVLTAEQKATLEELKEKMRKRMEERKGKGDGPKRGRRGKRRCHEDDDD